MAKDLLKALKVLTDSRRALSLSDIRKYDSGYEEALDRVVELRDQYESLPLKEEHRRTIDSLVDALDDVETEQVSMAYIAGMMDCVLMIDRLELFQP